MIDVQHELIFQAWACVLGNERATYLSGPITTGLRWVEAVESGRTEAARKDVIAENSRAIRAVADRLRHEDRHLLVEPTALTMPGWAQSDYLSLWTALIERHAADVLFMPDWHYSIGCVMEFERASACDIPTRRVDGTTMAKEEGLGLMRSAIADVEGRARSYAQLYTLARSIETVVERLVRS